MNKKRIYLDHAATTPVRPEVVEAMQPYFTEVFGNPSSLYREGRDAKNALDQSRAAVAKVMNCKPEEIIFTGSGTESDNLAIMGVARARATEGKHIVTTTVEHHAVLHVCKELAKEGFEITYVPVDGFGKVKMADLKAAIRPDTILVSIMYANNEIGTINPMAEIVKLVKSVNPKTYVHTDACQAAGYLSLDVKALGVDMLTINGSKIYGPKGVGALFVKAGTKIKPIVHGGGQERNLRSGTESTPILVGFATALAMANDEREAESARLIPLRDKLIAGMLKSLDKAILNGHPTDRLPNNVNVTVLDVEGEAMLFYLDEEGIAASTGSACTSGTLDPSHVILATGLPYEAAHGSLRFTLGRSTTDADIDHVLKVLPGIIANLRDISPANIDMNDFMKKVNLIRQTA